MYFPLQYDFVVAGIHSHARSIPILIFFACYFPWATVALLKYTHGSPEASTAKETKRRKIALISCKYSSFNFCPYICVCVLLQRTQQRLSTLSSLKRGRRESPFISKIPFFRSQEWLYICSNGFWDDIFDCRQCHRRSAPVVRCRQTIWEAFCGITVFEWMGRTMCASVELDHSKTVTKIMHTIEMPLHGSRQPVNGFTFSRFPFVCVCCQRRPAHMQKEINKFMHIS